MPIRRASLHTLLLRVGPASLVGDALNDLRTRPRAAEWLLIYRQGAGYVVLGLADLAARAAADPALLARRFVDLAAPISLTIDADADLDTARARLGASGYLMVLRDDQPYGVLAATPGTLAGAPAQALLDHSRSWSSSPATLSEDAQLPHPAAAVPAVFESIVHRNDRYVNTDFASDEQPDRAIDKQRALRPGQWCYFRMSIGEIEDSSIEARPTLLPTPLLDHAAELRVVIFSEFFMVTEDTGIFYLPGDGPASVRVPASTPAGLAPDAALLRERLLFRLHVPARVGLADLRVNLYSNGMLIQSRLVTARVGVGRPLAEGGAQRMAVLDFNLSATLAPGLLSAIAPHTLSIMLNSDSAGNQSFRLLGQQGQELFANSATLGAGEVADLIALARGALQRATWGYPGEWDGQAPYRYDPATPAGVLQAQFADDLFTLAAEGARFYAAIKNNLGQGKQGAADLRALMRRPGVVQMAAKIAASDIVPIGLLYDYRLDSQASLTICPQFEASLASGRALASEPCFCGECPSRDDLSVVCPSGFWGFRHDIGMPTPTPNGPELALTIGYTNQPLIDMAVYADFPLLPGHLARVDQLAAVVQRQSQREQITSMFHTTQPQLVYFYCHGLLQGTKPALKVGSLGSPGYFTLDSWSNLAIEWPQARPLMFINGCHTTAITPAQALNLVKVLVEDVEAAGVLGTEITIFEPLAQAFAELLLPLFLAGMPLGRAVRTARLGLLAQRNLLGLAYTAHAYADLRLVKSS